MASSAGHCDLSGALVPGKSRTGGNGEHGKEGDNPRGPTEQRIRHDTDGFSAKGKRLASPAMRMSGEQKGKMRLRDIFTHQ